MQPDEICSRISVNTSFLCRPLILSNPKCSGDIAYETQIPDTHDVEFRTLSRRPSVIYLIVNKLLSLSLSLSYRPSVIHLIVNKLLPLSLSLSLSLALALAHALSLFTYSSLCSYVWLRKKGHADVYGRASLECVC